MAHRVKLEEWEDMDTSEVGEDLKQLPEHATPRKRKTRRVSSSSSFAKPLHQRPVPRMKQHSRPPSRAPSAARWNVTASSFSVFALDYILEVLRFALVVLRRPLSLILVGYLLAVMVSHLHHAFRDILYSSLAPVCLLPGVSRIAFCRSMHPGGVAPTFPRKAPQRAEYPRLIDIQSATFEQLLDDSVGGAGLALEIKKAELATSDLTTLVKGSRLTSREKMVETLGNFVDDAKRTGRGLQKFSAKVNSAVDGIIAVNDYALKRIEQAASDGSSPSLWRSILVPFSHHSASRTALTASFTQAMTVLESELHTLILAAEASLHDLDTLEAQLKLLHGIVSREDESLNISKQELLSQLWTMLGGNRAELWRYDSHLKLLSGLNEYRQKALAHVVGALQTLQTMSADLEALRERASQPALSSEIIPLEVHVRSIRGGLERLTSERLKAKKIEDARYAKLVEPLGE